MIFIVHFINVLAIGNIYFHKRETIKIDQNDFPIVLWGDINVDWLMVE